MSFPKLLGSEPAYLHLLNSGELAKRAALSTDMLSQCCLCPRQCGTNRYEEPGLCKVGHLALVSSYGPHRGEETPLSGWRGSGTIFFTGCNLHCVYCQNDDISQSTCFSQQFTPHDLASVMLNLQKQGCHNINLVSPSHVVPQILGAILEAATNGLRLPIVYNTGGYDSMDALHLLDGVVDIYMPDMKYSSEQISRRLSNINNYPIINQRAVKEMHRQVGDLHCDKSNIAIRGLLVRHLVLPNNLAGTIHIAKFLAEEISTNTYFNLMDQFRPASQSHKHPDINRPITREEFSQALSDVRLAGLTRLDRDRFL
jgi:putative pyruvate formate lyase activating enzyme